MTGTFSSVKSEQDRMAYTRALLSGTGTGALAQSRGLRRLRGNREGNVLLGALLHAGARLDAGLTLTDLEQRVVDAVAKYVPPAELRAFGRAYVEARAAGPIAMLPESVTRRPVETGYTIAEFKDDLPAIARQVVAQPNVQIIDVSKHADTDTFDTEQFTAAMAEHGRGITILTGPPAPVDTQGLLNVRLRMLKFQCVRESGEVGRDEIFWGVSAGSDTTAKKSFKTREYGATSSGDWHTFDYDYNAGQTYAFVSTVDQHLTTEFQCWEADDSSGGFYNDLRGALADFAEAAADVSTDITASADDAERKAAGWSAWLALGAGLINAILGWITNDDDLVCERSIGYDRAALLALRNRPGREGYYNFDGGGGGHHRLYLATNEF